MGMQELKMMKELKSDSGLKEENKTAIAHVYLGSQFYDCFTNFRIISPHEIEIKRFDGRVERIYNATVVVRYKESEEK